MSPSSTVKSLVDDDGALLGSLAQQDVERSLAEIDLDVNRFDARWKEA